MDGVIGEGCFVKLQVGDFVIVKKFKASTRPSRRAKDIDPATHGDTYSYRIDKYWKVVEVGNDGRIEIETRRGKRHTIDTRNQDFRKANLFDRFFHRDRFF